MIGSSRSAATASQVADAFGIAASRARTDVSSLRDWLGLDRHTPIEITPLRDTLDALDHMDPDRARARVWRMKNLPSAPVVSLPRAVGAPVVVS